MTFVKYLLNTSGGDILSDIAEFRKLGRCAASARRNMFLSRARMTCNFGKDFRLVPSAKEYCGCIQTSWHPELDFETGFNVLKEYKLNCPYFVPSWWPCDMQKCSYYKHNNDYFENKSKYEYLKNQRAKIWAEKFSRVK